MSSGLSNALSSLKKAVLTTALHCAVLRCAVLLQQNVHSMDRIVGIVLSVSRYAIPPVKSFQEKSKHFIYIITMLPDI